MAGITNQAKRYAQAALQVARQDNSIESWQTELSKLVTLAKIPEFVEAMNYPAWEYKKKFDLLESQFTTKNVMVLNLVFILIEKGKFNLVHGIKAAFDDLVDEINGVERAEITSAIPLDNEEKNKLNVLLAELRGKKISLTEKVDEGIIGGVIIRIGGKIIDGSTSGRLTALSNRLAEAHR
ncbi:MAG TPA: ATP synthase F1 subunit delta [Dehalococcoidales bacterium]|nr:ATP synthase F1 subunit delta [Dehalococcoidales bacterium]